MSKPARVVSKEMKMAAVALATIILMATFPMMIPLISVAIMILFPASAVVFVLEFASIYLGGLGLAYEWDMVLLGFAEVNIGLVLGTIAFA